MEQKSIEEWSREKLKKYIEEEIKKLFSGILDYTEVAVDSPDRWKALRSKILKLSNDTSRGIVKEIDSRYTVNCAITEDVINFNKNTDR